jgi:hypothetical protein
MNENHLRLATRHGVLKERIAAQRRELVRHVQPVEEAFGMADKAVAGVDWLKENPLAVGGAFAVLAILKPSRAWRWAKRGFFAWRTWQGAKKALLARFAA